MFTHGEWFVFVPWNNDGFDSPLTVSQTFRERDLDAVADSSSPHINVTIASPGAVS
jgi:hypothetical protein